MRANLMPEKLALLQKRLRGEAQDDGLDATIIMRRRGDRPAPLSFSQARLWFLYELAPNSPAYNEAFATWFKGILDLKSFEQAFLEIIRRHEILRTTYQVIDGEPVQIIAPSVEWHLPVIDLSELSLEARQAEMHRLS